MAGRLLREAVVRRGARLLLPVAAAAATFPNPQKNLSLGSRAVRNPERRQPLPGAEAPSSNPTADPSLARYLKEIELVKIMDPPLLLKLKSQFSE